MADVHPSSPAAEAPARQHAHCRTADSGLITLEWLLIVGLIAGLAATTSLVVQQVVDDTSEARPDPLVRLLEADVAAAFIAADAQAAFEESLQSAQGYVDQTFEGRCLADLADDYRDVVALAVWTAPTDPGTPGDPDDDDPARCDVTPVPNLGEG